MVDGDSAGREIVLSVASNPSSHLIVENLLTAAESASSTVSTIRPHPSRSQAAALYHSSPRNVGNLTELKAAQTPDPPWGAVLFIDASFVLDRRVM